ncbi:SH3 domain-containing protein [Leptospira bouyouniensis]|uniref:SH3 domain-containing protein n=1 Tax=Leptospira bouyouniensis TaxID=2484911 RepID=A0A7I0HWF3_9LEPT|nr:SH3 domain-containing protein [Leptospira bouyouniensis]TGL09139.1 SH3 domain-containing protein [Leptospira bouyouniensis]
MKKIYYILLILLNLHISTVFAKDMKFLKRLSPHYSELTDQKINVSELFFKKMKIDGKPEDYFDKEIEFRKFKVTIPRKAKGEIISFSYKKKIKKYNSNKFGYNETNNCEEDAMFYQTEKIKRGLYDCGRTLSIGMYDASEVCWDFNVKKQVTENCREKTYVFQDGYLLKPKNDVSECSYRCYDMIPFLDIGEYEVFRERVFLREEPSTSSKIISTLKKGQVLKLLEDTGIIEEIEENIAPWVKVSTQSGIEGYVFGALIKVPGELRY